MDLLEIASESESAKSEGSNGEDGRRQWRNLTARAMGEVRKRVKCSGVVVCVVIVAIWCVLSVPIILFHVKAESDSSIDVQVSLTGTCLYDSLNCQILTSLPSILILQHCPVFSSCFTSCTSS